MMRCLLMADLHGSLELYNKLFKTIKRDTPDAVFLAGDLLPSPMRRLVAIANEQVAFLEGFLIKELGNLKTIMGKKYPDFYVILGNDDPRSEEESLIEGEKSGVWTYVQQRIVSRDGHDICGYSYIPPSPYQLKDWERYDVSRFVDPGCVSPEEGKRTVEVPEREKKYATIKNDLEELLNDRATDSLIFMAHCPPYQTLLDRADLAGRMVDHAPIDVNIGSIAIRRFIEQKQPLVTLHGHVHESARLTGAWRDKIGRTHMFNAAHDGRELAVISFDTDNLDGAIRELI